ncbi:MAG: YHS domain-containing protein [Planctomycetes bacterium]|nr:YHS domain-containing protein [Planctomycetota bacterium]
MSSKRPMILALAPAEGSKKNILYAHNKYWKEEGRKRNYFIVHPEIVGLRFMEYDDFKTLFGAIMEVINKKFPSNVDEKKIAIAGISNGGIGALTAFVFHPDKLACCVVFPGAIHPEAVQIQEKHLKTESLKGKHVYMLVGERDVAWKAGCDRVVEEIKKYGIKVKYEVLKNEEHLLDVKPSVIFKWIDDTLGIKSSSGASETPPKPDSSSKCPVDNKNASSKITLDHEGTKYSFCSDKCKNAFKKEPGKYMKGKN